MRPLLGPSAASILILVVVACHDPESRPPTSPTAPSLASVDIIVPASIAPGQSVQLVATAKLSNGPTKTATSETTVLWRTTADPAMLHISSAGVATAGQVRGEGIVTADVTVGTLTRRGQRTILVMPDGTVRVVGTVKDIAFPFAPIAGARVEVVGGDPATITDSSGQYRLYGVPPLADIQVSAAGYETQKRQMTQSTNTTQNFQVRYNGPLPGLSGNYTLAIDVPGACSGAGFPPLPAALRHRTYDATVTQNGKVLEVTLSGANFRVDEVGSGNRFGGEVFGTGATFSLQTFSPVPYYYYGPQYPSVAEVLPDGTYLLPVGFAVTSGSASGLSGTMHGAALMQWNAKFPDATAQIVSMCNGDLQFALTPR